MSNWKTVKLTQARQVAELMGADEAALPDPEIGAQAHYEALRDADRLIDAIDFLGHAMPRYEAVSWAAHILHAESKTHQIPMRDRLALDHSLRWLGDPDDAKRRATRDAAEAASDRSPERMLGMAVFFSGGSLSNPDLPPVLPPPQVSCRCAVGAVKAAAFRTDTPESVLKRALQLAEAVAEQGVKALAAA
jgi:hypothetical protein